MCAAIRSLPKALLLIAVLVSMAGATPRPVVASMPVKDILASRVFFPEVRLRKMHLVRPDLIPYPVFFNIYC